MLSVCCRLVIAAVLLSVTSYSRAACVWKVTSAAGNVLYLAGSIHALQSTDYPLPSAYNRAFDVSERLVCEVDPKALVQSSRGLIKAGEYPKGDCLRNHFDLRTYDYLRRLLKIVEVPETTFAAYSPSFLSLLPQAPS